MLNYKNKKNKDNLNILDDVQLVETISSNSIEVYNVYSQHTYLLEKFEPTSNIYSGIYLEENTGNFIKNFEDPNNIYQNIYLNEMTLEEDFLLSWVLACYSNSKIPFITISPPDNLSDMYNKSVLLERAKEFGNLNIPIFVNFYPLNPNTKELIGDNIEDYISFMQTSSNYFNVYAPNVSFIWSVDFKLAYESKEYYAGDSYLNWVGLDIYENLNNNSQLEVMFNELDYFYNLYSNSSPIFINLKISHFGDDSYTYNIADKLNELNRYYVDYIQKYPRLKMINYINQDMFKINKSSSQNYLITDNQEILDLYKYNLSQNNFSKEFISNDSSTYPVSSLKKEEVVAYKHEDKFFKDNLLSISYDLDDILINNSQKYIIIK